MHCFQKLSVWQTQSKLHQQNTKAYENVEGLSISNRFDFGGPIGNTEDGVVDVPERGGSGFELPDCIVYIGYRGCRIIRNSATRLTFLRVQVSLTSSWATPTDLSSEIVVLAASLNAGKGWVFWTNQKENCWAWYIGRVPRGIMGVGGIMVFAIFNGSLVQSHFESNVWNSH